MSLRDIERESIRAFLQEQSPFFAGARVLDYGCGDQPYRGLIEEAGGTYVGYDSPEFSAHVASDKPKLTDDPFWNDETFDVVVCTQVIQYLPIPRVLLSNLRDLTASSGVLFMTGPTNWPIVEMGDLWRFTVQGVLHLLKETGWTQRHVARRGDVKFEGETWPLGWQAIARP